MRVLRNVLLSIAGVLFVGLLGVFLYLFGPAYWNRWVTYPEWEAQVEAFKEQRREPSASTTLNTYRGAIHAHSYWSHDSEGTLHSILPAAKKAGLAFIFLSDHPHGNLDSFPRGYHGYYDGILIEPGSEKHGYCMWPLDSTVIDWSVDRDTLIRDVVSRGGMFLYAHSEEPHNWSNPWYQGMEIYNIHTDSKDESWVPHIANFIVNGSRYRNWALREIFDEQVAILQLWDSLNTTRKIIGFSAVDAHENQNFRARMLDDGRVQWVGPNAKPVDTVELSVWNRWMFSDPDEEGWVFKFLMDTYESGFNFVVNYVLADTLSTASLSDHILRGHLYTGFQDLGDASGFLFWSQDTSGNTSAILGDSVQQQHVASLHATAPLPSTFRLIRNGIVVDESPGNAYDYTWSKPIEPGVYRVEVHVTLAGKTLPWIYSNPIVIYD